MALTSSFPPPAAAKEESPLLSSMAASDVADEAVTAGSNDVVAVDEVEDVLGMMFREMVSSGSWSSNVALASGRIWRKRDAAAAAAVGTAPGGSGVVEEVEVDGRWIACREMEG